jgi:hypothetical protein
MEICGLREVLAAADGVLNRVVVALHNKLIIARIGCDLISLQSLDGSPQINYWVDVGFSLISDLGSSLDLLWIFARLTGYISDQYHSESPSLTQDLITSV